MKILAIETSCDDTCIAIVEADKRGYQRGFTQIKFNVLSNIVSSQVEIHKRWGGVYPTLAKREHQKNLVPVLLNALKKAGLLKKSKAKLKIKNLKPILEREELLQKKLRGFLQNYQQPKIDAIAVTVGPGLEPCLWVGVNFARALSYFWQLPIIPINHIEAHIFASFVNTRINANKNTNQHKNLFPAICLVVSGGHTQLILMRGIGKYKIIGETRDDAAGECFDKVARILNLGYPGGPAIAEQARQWQSNIQYPISNIQLPRPMIYQKNYDFSFSGLKTAVLYLVKQLTMNNKQLTIKQKGGICAETQQAVIDVLIHKTLRAAKEYKAKTIILGGGVVANDELRKQFKSNIQYLTSNIQFLMPDVQLCTDNAAMVGATAYYHHLKQKTKSWKNIQANANLRIG